MELEEGVLRQEVGGGQSPGRARALCATGRCSDRIPLDFGHCWYRCAFLATVGLRPGPGQGRAFLPLGGSHGGSPAPSIIRS